MADPGVASIASTMCWNCSKAYPPTADQCPHCCATNANVDLESAQIEMGDKSRIDHDWKFISDWYGDPGVINGTADCSRYECQRCGAVDNDREPPSYDDNY